MAAICDKSINFGQSFYMPIFILIFISFMIGGAIVGAFIATLVLVGLLLLAATGVLSTSIIVGLYKRSFAAGFRTFLLIICGAGGIIAGAGGFLLINHFFHLHVTRTTAAWSGAAGGLLGGLLLGLSMFAVIRELVIYFKAKISSPV